MEPAPERTGSRPFWPLALPLYHISHLSSPSPTKHRTCRQAQCLKQSMTPLPAALMKTLRLKHTCDAMQSSRRGICQSPLMVLPLDGRERPHPKLLRHQEPKCDPPLEQRLKGVSPALTPAECSSVSLCQFSQHHGKQADEGVPTQSLGIELSLTDAHE